MPRTRDISTIRHRGTALVTALLVMALATIAATEFAKRLRIDVRRTDNVLSSDQAYLYALGVESWAAQVLARDRRGNEVDHLAEPWAGILEPTAIERGQLSGRMEDLQARFNLNNLLDAAGRTSESDLEIFRRLLQALELEPALAQAAADWADQDIEPALPDGAEDGIYLGRQPAYRTPNAPFVSPSELMLVKGFTAEAFARLEPYVTALPRRTNININTAPAPVLMAVVRGLGPAQADALVEARGLEGYSDIAQFRGQQALEGRKVDGIAVSSDYFLVESNARVGRGSVRLYSILARGAGGVAAVSVVVRARQRI